MKLKASIFIFLPLLFMLASSLRAQSTAPSDLSSLLTDFSYVTLDKYIQIAKENYPRVNALQLRKQAAQNEVRVQGLNWLDPLSFTFIYAPNSTFNVLDPTYFDGIQVGLSLNLASFLQKPLNVKRAKIDVKSADADIAEYMLTLENQVKQRYIAYLQAKSIVTIQSNAYLSAKSILEQTKTRYDRTEATFIEYNQALNSFGGAQQTKLTAEGSMLSAKANLEEILTRRLEDIK